MLTPLRNLLYILPIEDPEKRGSLFVPEQAKQKVDQGVVYLRGPKTSGEIKVGDVVCFSSFDGKHVAIEDEPVLIIIPENDVKIVLTEPGAGAIFPLATVERLITKGVGNLKSLGLAAGQLSAETVEEHLVNLFRSHFDAEGLHF